MLSFIVMRKLVSINVDKGVEMVAYLSNEYSDMMIEKARKFEKKPEE